MEMSSLPISARSSEFYSRMGPKKSTNCQNIAICIQHHSKEALLRQQKGIADICNTSTEHFVSSTLTKAEITAVDFCGQNKHVIEKNVKVCKLPQKRVSAELEEKKHKCEDSQKDASQQRLWLRQLLSLRENERRHQLRRCQSAGFGFGSNYLVDEIHYLMVDLMICGQHKDVQYEIDAERWILQIICSTVKAEDKVYIVSLEKVVKFDPTCGQRFRARMALVPANEDAPSKPTSDWRRLCIALLRRFETLFPKHVEHTDAPFFLQQYHIEVQRDPLHLKSADN